MSSLSPPRPSVLTILNGPTLRRLMPVADAIEIVQQAMIGLSNGRVLAPERWAVEIGGGNRLGFMPGAMPDLGSFGAKLISLFDEAAVCSHQGLMLLFDLNTGAPIAVLDGGVLTGLRTAATTAAATRAMARPDTASAALLGCGEQARWHSQALMAVRPITLFHLWSRTPERAQAMAGEIERSTSARAQVHASAREAVDAADIICTLTSAREPILEGAWLRPGQHVNLVGSSTRETREIDDVGVARSHYVVDERSHALSQAGELRHAMQSGAVEERHVVGEIGQVFSQQACGRPDAAAITLYKSLGHVVQDISVARAAVIRGLADDRLPNIAW